jgi:hypothetical protein
MKEIIDQMTDRVLLALTVVILIALAPVFAVIYMVARILSAFAIAALDLAKWINKAMHKIVITLTNDHAKSKD